MNKAAIRLQDEHPLRLKCYAIWRTRGPTCDGPKQDSWRTVGGKTRMLCLKSSLRTLSISEVQTGNATSLGMVGARTASPEIVGTGRPLASRLLKDRIEQACQAGLVTTGLAEGRILSRTRTRTTAFTSSNGLVNVPSL